MARAKRGRPGPSGRHPLTRPHRRTSGLTFRTLALAGLFAVGLATGAARRAGRLAPGSPPWPRTLTFFPDRRCRVTTRPATDQDLGRWSARDGIVTVDEEP